MVELWNNYCNLWFIFASRVTGRIFIIPNPLGSFRFNATALIVDIKHKLSVPNEYGTETLMIISIVSLARSVHSYSAGSGEEASGQDWDANRFAIADTSGTTGYSGHLDRSYHLLEWVHCGPVSVCGPLRHSLQLRQWRLSGAMAKSVPVS